MSLDAGEILRAGRQLKLKGRRGGASNGQQSGHLQRGLICTGVQLPNCDGTPMGRWLLLAAMAGLLCMLTSGCSHCFCGFSDLVWKPVDGKTDCGRSVLGSAVWSSESSWVYLSIEHSRKCLKNSKGTRWSGSLADPPCVAL